MNRAVKFTVAGLITVSLALLLGCSSGSNDTEPNANGTLTGRFLDSPVSGLSYATSSGLQGKTNAAGEFEYVDGDTVTFSIEGVLELGSLLAASVITPFDLVGYELQGDNLSLSDLLSDIVLADQSDSATRFEQGVNMLILLQSLDSNNNADDGIELSQAVLNFFATNVITLLFNTDTRDFIEQFLQLFVLLVTDGILSRDAGDEPVDRDAALLHFLNIAKSADIN